MIGTGAEAEIGLNRVTPVGPEKKVINVIFLVSKFSSAFFKGYTASLAWKDFFCLSLQRFNRGNCNY
jgi:hypothetical protein